MAKIRNIGIQNKPPLDTLAQLRKSDVKLSGKLTTLQKRARSKWYTENIALRLKYTVNQNDKLYKMYSHAANCCSLMTQTNGNEIKSKFCNTRICNVCNRIRTAKMMNGYISQMQKFSSIEFITLTIPNCKAEDLPGTIAIMYKEIYNIIGVFRKKKDSIHGIRKLEITYNNETDTYHPHYHLLIEGGKGKLIVNEWLKRFPKANIKGQDYREADNNSLNEIFKYTTKILFKNKENKGSFLIIANAINTIMSAMYGKRSIQAFGCIRKVSEEVDEDIKILSYEGVKEYEFMEWIWNSCDWVNKVNETLSGYINPDIEFVLIE